VQRADDKPETVRGRLRVYHQDTVELIPYYDARGALHTLQGDGDIKDVYESILKAIKPVAERKC
jgi:adenylate kinase